MKIFINKLNLMKKINKYFNSKLFKLPIFKSIALIVVINRACRKQDFVQLEVDDI